MTASLRSALGILTLASVLAIPAATALACSYETSISTIPVVAQARCGSLGCADEPFVDSARGDRYRSGAPDLEDGGIYVFSVSGCFFLGYGGDELGKPVRRATVVEAVPFIPFWVWPLVLGMLLYLPSGIRRFRDRRK